MIAISIGRSRLPGVFFSYAFSSSVAGLVRSRLLGRMSRRHSHRAGPAAADGNPDTRRIGSAFGERLRQMARAHPCRPEHHQVWRRHADRDHHQSDWQRRQLYRSLARHLRPHFQRHVSGHHRLRPAHGTCERVRDLQVSAPGEGERRCRAESRPDHWKARDRLRTHS